MKNSDIRTKLIEFIAQKNLPLDLQVEILDHISEQINYKMEIEQKDFSLAFSEIKESWKEDLAMKKTFFSRKSRTKIYRETFRRTNFEILKKTSFYFLFYFIISISLLFYSKTVASNFIFAFYSSLLFVFAFLLILNFKILNFSTIKKDREISYLQKGIQIYTFASIYIPFLILINYDERFAKYYYSIVHLVDGGQFNMVSFGIIMIFNMYAFGWFYGLLYFVEYKKSLKILEQKINFKL